MTANLAPPPVSDLLNHRGLDVVLVHCIFDERKSQKPKMSYNHLQVS